MKLNMNNFLYIGTYTNPFWLKKFKKSNGIYFAKFNSDNGSLNLLGSFKSKENPSFIHINNNGTNLYSISENYDNEGGVASSYKIEEDGSLKVLNHQLTGSTGPCYLTTDKEGEILLVANYGIGASTLFPLSKKNGELKPYTSLIIHKGKSIIPDRQDMPHAHSIELDNSEKFVLVPDLGIDKILVYKLDKKNLKLKINKNPFGTVGRGYGPRHISIHKNNSWVYVLNEINSSITLFYFNSTDGNMKSMQNISTLPDDYKKDSYCADIHISNNGKFVYASNRGHDSIALFSIDQNNGTLKIIDIFKTLGKNPRNFCVSPNDKYLLIANQDTHNINVFKINENDGKINFTNQTVDVPFPVCLKLK
tara:strand:- start:211 stop:1302 length:1092 start_codon:yes stop_codon:yes gene_type:complete